MKFFERVGKGRLVRTTSHAQASRAMAASRLAKTAPAPSTKQGAASADEKSTRPEHDAIGCENSTRTTASVLCSRPVVCACCLRFGSPARCFWSPACSRFWAVGSALGYARPGSRCTVGPSALPPRQKEACAQTFCFVAFSACASHRPLPSHRQHTQARKRQQEKDLQTNCCHRHSFARSKVLLSDFFYCHRHSALRQWITASWKDDAIGRGKEKREGDCHVGGMGWARHR